MKLNEEERAMLAGEMGEVVQIAMQHQIMVGDFFGARDFVPITQAHVMADTESLGQAGVMWLERLCDVKDGLHRVRVPTITDPRGTDFSKADDLGQRSWMLELERRAINAFVKLGVSMTDTCINYQTVLAATRGEHVAFGDTGVVIYSNSINGARSNFGSIALFHIVGITPEASRLEDVGGQKLPVRHRINRSDIDALTKSYAVEKTIDVVVFSAPQLSLYELRSLAELCDGRRFKIPLLAVTSPQVKPDADRFGFTERIEAAGGTVMSGMCFYQSYAREIAEAKGWKRLASNSAKLVNILGGYGYVPMLASMEECVNAAETGELK